MANQFFPSSISHIISRGMEIFGDSIMKGIMLDPSGRYYVNPSNAANSLMNEFPGQISNRAKFGCTIVKGYALVERWVKTAPKSSAVLLEFGGNDCDFDWNKVAEAPNFDHQPNTPLPIFVDTYEKMINMLCENGASPIVMNLPPIDPNKFFDWITRNGADKNAVMEFLGDMHHIYRHQELYSQTVTNLAAKTGAKYVDVRGAFLYNGNYSRLICDDGIHPNEEGQQLIKEVLLSACTA